jgi:hypothetical protein
MLDSTITSGNPGFVELIGDVDLQFAEHAPEARELRRLELLPGEAEHAMLAERTQDPLERFVRDRLGKVHALDPAPIALPGSIFMSTLKLGPPLPAMVAPAAGVAEARATGAGGTSVGAAHRRGGPIPIVC